MLRHMLRLMERRAAAAGGARRSVRYRQVAGRSGRSRLYRIAAVGAHGAAGLPSLKPPPAPPHPHTYIFQGGLQLYGNGYPNWRNTTCSDSGRKLLRIWARIVHSSILPPSDWKYR